MLFLSLGYKCAQVLLTYENFVDRIQFLNARNTLNAMLDFGVVPIVNENDSVGVQELKADNDKLAAMVVNAVGDCDLLFLLTDVNGVYTSNPLKNPNAQRIPYVKSSSCLRGLCAGFDEGSEWGTGGMAAKVTAGTLATSLGVRTVIMSADDVSGILDYCETFINQPDLGNPVDDSCNLDDFFKFGTTLESCTPVPREHKGWIRTLHRRGCLIVDDGAKRAIGERKNLFAVGLKEVIGSFTALEAVSIHDTHGNEVAYALVNFSSDDLNIIKGLHTDEVYQKLSQSGVIVSRKNMDVIMDDDERQTF